MRERLSLRLARVLEQRAAGADREREVLAAEPGERRSAELLQQLLAAAVGVELPGWQPGNEVAFEVHIIRGEHFGRVDSS